MSWHARCKYGRQRFNQITIMKNNIKLLALVLAAGLPCVAFAQVAGANLPTSLNTESVFGAFAIIGITLGAVSDYSRTFRPLPLTAARSVSAAPTLVVHQPAYGIRRGAEVARLAA
jgi:xanthine/uracil permease